MADLVSRTAALYPALRPYLKDVAFRSSPAAGPNMLEFYGPSESDSFSPGKPAIETFGQRARPADVAGDLVSHFLGRGVDPSLSFSYRQFAKSLTPFQHGVLRDQYRWAQRNEGETRPYSAWASLSGVPAFFRGYTFGQWPGRENLYTRVQRAHLDALLSSLRQGRTAQAPH